MKKVVKTISNALWVFGIAVPILLNMIIVSDGKIERDIFGFIIPHPPVWTSYIPFAGPFLEYMFLFFSIHGLVIIFIGIVLILAAIWLSNWADK